MSDLNVTLQTEFRNYKQDTMSVITYGNSSYLHTTYAYILLKYLKTW